MGLNAAGWAVGVVYAVGTWVLLGRALRRSGTTFLGPANQVTLARATLVGGVAALAADWLTGHAVPVVVFVTLAAVALALDAVDGQVARRTNSTSALGARFDMEVDAVLILVLSAVVAQFLGPWVLAIGAFRYAFVAASWALPWLRAALPHRMSRKTVAAIQGVVLAAASSGILPYPMAMAVVGTALALLIWSFSRDVAWLWRAHEIQRFVAAAVALPYAPESASGTGGNAPRSIGGNKVLAGPRR
ncbi:membrane protein [Phytohabitans flavus]|uniref:Membrane protein n=1 Tax=Phytohabitans flavus TaxID=1076124 RepID=A0A6F8XQN0_9ACTN|nr:CDP-alcohol phosphatidyltransferase family protein [Phytohabitans flavus]BCB76117.1 membrane protein [Phytohabitans flavus]